MQKKKKLKKVQANIVLIGEFIAMNMIIMCLSLRIIIAQESKHHILPKQTQHHYRPKKNCTSSARINHSKLEQEVGGGWWRNGARQAERGRGFPRNETAATLSVRSFRPKMDMQVGRGVPLSTVSSFIFLWWPRKLLKIVGGLPGLPPWIYRGKKGYSRSNVWGGALGHNYQFRLSKWTKMR